MYVVKGSKKKYLEASYAVALASPGVGGSSHRNFRIGAVLVNGKSKYSAFNSYRTSPKLCSIHSYPYTHAESGVILKAGLLNCIGATLYITRVRRDGSIALSKPCLECQALIELARIKRVIYSVDNGYERL